jgi:hypothetical protein
MKLSEFDIFNSAMDTILRVDPVQVKAAVDAEIQAHTAERKTRGEHKRGRKPKPKQSTSASGHDLTAQD